MYYKYLYITLTTKLDTRHKVETFCSLSSAQLIFSEYLMIICIVKCLLYWKNINTFALNNCITWGEIEISKQIINQF